MSTSEKNIRVTCQGAMNLALDELVEFQGGLKKLSKKNMEKLKARILEDGFNVPFFVWKHDGTNSLLDGHQRIKALKSLQGDGYEIPPLPVAIIEATDIADAKKKLLAISSQYGEFDGEELSQWLDELGDDIADTLRIVDGEMETLLKDPEETEGDDDVANAVDSITELGDVWHLGGHRLLCGDSTDAEMVAKLMDGQKADMVLTDPPYGMKKEADGVLNDNLNYDDLLQFNKQWIPLTFDALKDNGSWYCWGIDEPLMDIYSEILKPKIKAREITFRNLITWDKGFGQSQNSELTRSYATADEKCLFVMCGVQGFNNNSDNYFEAWEPIRQYLANEAEKAGIGAKELREITGVGMWGHWFTKSQWTFIPEEHYKKLQAFGKEYGAFGKEYEQIKKEYEQIKKEYYSTRVYFNNTHDNMNNVWHFDRTGNKERELTGGHATPKPIALCSRAIKSSSREGEIVLDFFGGSGSTLIACEKLNRSCYMMELDPHYCDVIVTRYAKWCTENGIESKILRNNTPYDFKELVL